MSTRATARASGHPRVRAEVLLVLLEALRVRDTPTDITPEENPHPDLPQRLGMSDVILDQIRRYRRLAPRGRVDAAEALDLVRLVVRRSDATATFDLAGRSLAARAYGRRSALFRLALRALPGRVRLRAAFRHVRSRAGALFGAADFHVVHAPTAGLYAQGWLGARAGSGEACRFVSAFLEETILRFTGEIRPIRHELCETMGDGRCVWSAITAVDS
jgi:hypothetical protein